MYMAWKAAGQLIVEAACRPSLGLLAAGLWAAAGLSGCFRPEAPLPLRSVDPTQQQMEVALGSWSESLGAITFGQQVFVDLSTGKQTIRSRQAWDLAFASGPGETAVFLNTANYTQAADLGEMAFGTDLNPVDPRTYAFRFDSASGGHHETVLGGWIDRASGQSRDHLWLLDLGFDTLLSPRGYRQLVIDSLVEDTYYFRYAGVSGEESRAAQVRKQPGEPLVFFSLEAGRVVEVAPPAANWDLVFTYYAYRYPDGIPYWLTGALTNRHRVKAREIPTADLAGLTLADTARLGWAVGLDEIGFDWKTYLFGPPARYETDTTRHYLVRDTEGIVYRLRFLDFYNEAGERGFPQMEYAPLLP